MRKRLLATTALCLGVCFGRGESLAQAAGADPSPDFTFNLDGLFWLMFGDIDQDMRVAPNGGRYADQDAKARLVVRANPQLTLAAGALFGVEFDLAATNRNDQAFNDQRLNRLSGSLTPYVERLYVYYQGQYGHVLGGRVDGVAETNAVVAPVSNLITGINQSGLSTEFEANPAAHEILPAAHYVGRPFTNTANFMNDSAKILYFSPRIAGLSLGVSFTPTLERSGDFRSAASQRFTFLDSGGIPNFANDAAHDAYEIGLSFDHKFSEIGVTAQASFAGASDPQAVISKEDTTAWTLGVNFTYQDLTVGGSYGHIQGAILGRAFDPTNVITAGLTQGRKIAQESFDLGATYAIENWILGVNYAWGEARIPAVATGGATLLFRTPNTSGTEFSVDYNLRKGVDLISAVQFINYDAGNLPGEQFPTRSATNLLFGTQIKF